MKKDKQIERSRYDERARSILVSGPHAINSGNKLGSSTFPPIFRTPYIHYEKIIRENVFADQDILELGAGTGQHTYALVQTRARVVASDISSNSLELLKKKLGRNVITRVADIEKLPFEANSFDVVASAGSLSYGDPDLVDAEINRVLRPGGMFLCVDSLHHNPIYKLNRWIDYLRGKRTKSTLINMPTVKRIVSISRNFSITEVFYHGSLSWVMPLISKLIGQDRAAEFSDYIDHLFKIQRSAFKFLMVAKGNKKSQAI